MSSNDFLQSPWSVAQQRYPSLTRDAKVDVCVIGGGVVGLTTALLLAKKGRDVMLVEADRVGSGESGKTTAHLTQTFDTLPPELERKYGLEAAKLTWDGLALAIRMIEEISTVEGIDCNFKRLPCYVASDDPFKQDQMREIAAAVGRMSQQCEAVPLALEPWPGTLKLRFDRQARIHPGQYLAGLARAAVNHGTEIVEETRVGSVSWTSPYHLTATNGHSIEAEHVVVAAHVPFTNRLLLHTKLAAYRSYVLGIRVTKGLFPDCLLRDLQDPYRYVRLEPGPHFDLLLVGGADHKTGKSPAFDPFEELEAFRKERLGIPGDTLYRWSGQIIEPVDGLPLIGENPGRSEEFVATGFGGDGFTFGTLAAHMICERLMGRTTEWDDLFQPSRTIVHGVREYLSENVDFPRSLIGDLLATDFESRVGALRPGEGAIFKLAGKRVALARTPDNRLIGLSPVCPHLGCQVHWNGTEQSWDCPCHGSRFAPTGEVLNGPAAKGLTPIPLEGAVQPRRVPKTAVMVERIPSTEATT